MLDYFFIVIAIALNLAGGGKGTMQAEAPSAGGSAQTAAAAGAYVAEPQVPTGKFTTATEIKPIMGATRANWVALREYDGQDLLYVTHVLSWRCGLVGLRVSVNGAPMRDWPLPPCQEDTAQPNAIPEEARIYETHPLGSVSSIAVEIVYDDLSRDSAEFERKAVLMP